MLWLKHTNATFKMIKVMLIVQEQFFYKKVYMFIIQILKLKLIVRVWFIVFSFLKEAFKIYLYVLPILHYLIAVGC